MLRVFHAPRRAARIALSIGILVGAGAGVSFVSGCSEQPDQQTSPPPQTPLDELLREADEKTWAQAVRDASIGAFTEYLQNFPNGSHAAEARERLAALEAQARRDADENAWTEARQADTAVAYANYLRNFPAGAHSAEARQRQATIDEQSRRQADEKAWEEALRLGTEAAFAAYLREFPDGAHIAEAHQHLAALEQQARKEADEKSWEEAERSGTIAAFSDYLRNFPNGSHAIEARRRIDALAGAKTGPGAGGEARTTSNGKTAPSKAKLRPTSGRSASAVPGNQPVYKAPPSANSNLWFRWFW